MKFTVEVDQNGFKGKMEIDFPTKAEKMAILTKLIDLGYKQGETLEGEVTTDKLKIVQMLSEESDKRLISLDITHEESGTKITDKELLDVYAEGNAIMGIVSGFIMQGVSLGKAKSLT